MSDYLRRQCKDTSTTTTGPAGSSPEQIDPEMGNAAMCEELKVEGALGRAFNRIAGASESNKDPNGLAFTNADLEQYLDSHLRFAEGEWFRSAKVGGVADKIMEVLDTDKNGEVSWVEFQSMVDSLRGQLIDGLGASASSAEIQGRANELYGEMANGGDAVGFETIEAGAKAQLPEDMEHKDLVAQLAALMVIDIVDLDESDKAVRDRTLTSGEWMGAVGDVIK
jgi:hypothetical protein